MAQTAVAPSNQIVSAPAASANATTNTGLMRACVNGEEHSRFAAVSLKDGTVLQVKPVKATFATKQAWQASVIQQIVDGSDVSFKTETRGASSGRPPADVKRLLTLARKVGYYAKNMHRASRLFVRMTGLQGYIAKRGNDPLYPMKGCRERRDYLEKFRQENPVEFFKLDEAPLAWKDGDQMRHIGFVRRKGREVFPRDNGVTWLVNDKGIVGDTLEHLGIPAGAELFAVKRKKVIETTYEKL